MTSNYLRLPIRTAGCIALALLSLDSPGVATGPPAQLSVVSISSRPILRVALPDRKFCLSWKHSVGGFPVSDCFELQDGQLFLVESQTIDFAAGLDFLPGDGVLTWTSESGYRVSGRSRAIAGNGFRLRVGSPQVDHRLVVGSKGIHLSRLTPGKSVVIEVAGGSRKDTS